ncbi:MAG TPA: Crp/Fnr family transcriptional regulator [Bacteroidales bacterium]|jgi:CRP-like cAMP-binding protein|nr:Crp/Fnr family transcriptional regulator [Bacteroidales bacterium]MDD4086102.1 Crp/Fnr family transcriptional regulator [Bacteroidales bacterium]MDY0084910.1 Crp/Fnr family transcriptional regulator [Bacteroidales bacterium]HPE42706.1 Crp/Fnr family transcriptional regulator [Bacteroidales bacterium]
MKRVLFNIQRIFHTTDDEMNAIESVMQIRMLEKNEFLLKENEICNTIGFIEQGSMRLFYESPDKDICNNFFFENSLVGSLASFLSQTPSIVTIAAIEKCEVLLFEYNNVVRLTREYPALKALAAIIMQEQLLMAEKREASLLKDSPEKRFKKLLEEHPKIFKRIPLHYVASYLGITPETLSRYRAKFLF